MADVLPKNRASDPHARDSSPLERQDTGKFSVKGDGASHATPDATPDTAMLILPAKGSLAPGGKLAAKLRNPATPASAHSNGESKAGKDAGTEGRAQQSLDPLSQVCTVLDGRRRGIYLCAGLIANRSKSYSEQIPHLRSRGSAARRTPKRAGSRRRVRKMGGWIRSWRAIRQRETAPVGAPRQTRSEYTLSYTNTQLYAVPKVFPSSTSQSGILYSRKRRPIGPCCVSVSMLPLGLRNGAVLARSFSPKANSLTSTSGKASRSCLVL